MESVDLSGKNFSGWEAVSLRVKNPRSIRHLDLSNNSLKELPENLSRFANLVSINLIGNPIKRVV